MQVVLGALIAAVAVGGPLAVAVTRPFLPVASRTPTPTPGDTEVLAPGERICALMDVPTTARLVRLRAASTRSPPGAAVEVELRTGPEGPVLRRGVVREWRRGRIELPARVERDWLSAQLCARNVGERPVRLDTAPSGTDRVAPRVEWLRSTRLRYGIVQAPTVVARAGRMKGDLVTPGLAWAALLLPVPLGLAAVAVVLRTARPDPEEGEPT